MKKMRFYYQSPYFMIGLGITYPVIETLEKTHPKCIRVQCRGCDLWINKKNSNRCTVCFEKYSCDKCYHIEKYRCHGKLCEQEGYEKGYVDFICDICGIKCKPEKDCDNCEFDYISHCSFFGRDDGW
jgi:hypothetical protein